MANRRATVFVVICLFATAALACSGAPWNSTRTNLPEPAYVHSWVSDNDAVRSIAFDITGDQLVIAHPNSVNVCDTINYNRLQRVQPTADVACAVFCPGTSQFAFVDYHGNVYCHDCTTGKHVRTLSVKKDTILDRVVVTNNPPSLTLVGLDQTLTSWDLETNKMLGSVLVSSAPLCQVLYIRKDDVFLVTDGNGIMYDVDRRSLRIVDRTASIGGDVVCVAASSDGRLVAIGGHEGRVVMWDRGTGSMQQYSVTDSTIQCIAFSCDDSLLLLGAGGRPLFYEARAKFIITKVSNMQPIVEKTIYQQLITAVAYHPTKAIGVYGTSLGECNVVDCSAFQGK